MLNSRTFLTNDNAEGIPIEECKRTASRPSIEQWKVSDLVLLYTALPKSMLI